MTGRSKAPGDATAGPRPARKRAPRKVAQAETVPQKKQTAPAAPAAVAPAAPSPLAEAIIGQTTESLAELSRNLGEAMTRANQIFSTALIDQSRNLFLIGNLDHPFLFDNLFRQLSFTPHFFEYFFPLITVDRASADQIHEPGHVCRRNRRLVYGNIVLFQFSQQIAQDPVR